MAVATPPSTPLPSPGGPLTDLALLRRLLREPAPVLDECARRFGPTFALRAGPVRVVVVGDPAHLADVFAAPTGSYRWGHVANTLGFIVGPTSMLVSDGDDHLRRRAAVQPALARRRLDAWIPMIVAETDRSVAERLRPALADDGVVDVQPIGRDLVLSITVRAFFGNGLQHRTAEIGEAFDELQGYLELPALRQLPHRIPGTRRARARAARRRVTRIVDDELARRRCSHPGDPGAAASADLLDTFVEDDAAMTTAEIHDQVTTLIGAGYDTTAATVAWAVQRATATPGVWDRLRAEADLAFGHLDRPGVAGTTPPVDPPGPATLRALPYARAVVHEALRLHPAGLFAPRQAVVDIAVGDHVIPRGAMVLWCPYLAGRHPDVWDDPLAFRPERHLDPTPAQAALADTAWVPFGKGPRRCIGFALAQMELTLILARLAQHLDLELLEPTVPRPHGMVVNRPEGGVRVRERSRVAG